MTRLSSRPRRISGPLQGVLLLAALGFVLLLSGWGTKDEMVEGLKVSVIEKQPPIIEDHHEPPPAMKHNEATPKPATTEEDAPVKKSKTFAIVAASSSNHFKSFLRFCRRIASLVKDADTQLVAYDLGLTDKEHNEMASKKFNEELESSGLFRPMDFRTFDYSKYPEHYDVNVAKGEYAWKSAIIWEVLQEYEKIIWIDAGTNINEHISNMTLWNEMKDRISEDGVWCGASSPDVKKWTHPGTLAYFNISNDDPILRKGNFAATIIGVDQNFPGAIDKIIKPWYDCALVRECIAPEGSSRENHRQDQAALTVIMHLNEWSPHGISCDGCGWGLPKFFKLWEEAERGFN